MKKLLSLSLSLSMVMMTLFAVPFTAKAVNSYEISNYDELKAFASLVNGGVSGANAKLTDDIIATDTEWTPIGDYDIQYTGTFDGGGHTITGLSNAGVGSLAQNTGLFGYVNTSGVIQSVTLKETRIIGTSYVGGIAGYNRGTIQNCHFSGAVSSTNANATIGGIVGYNYGGTITVCSNSGAVTVSGQGSNIASAGGLVGYNAGGTITVCYNTGAVAVANDNMNAGGLVGYNANSGIITDCYNTGAIFGTGTGSSICIGGLVGYNQRSCTVQNCYNTGDVSGVGSDISIGGVVGKNSGGTVVNCYYNSKLNVADNGVGTPRSIALMTGPNAANNMGFINGNSSDSPWIAKSDAKIDGRRYWFYPHLKGFNLDPTTREQLTPGNIAMEEWPAKAEVTVEWNGYQPTYIYDGTDKTPTPTVTVGGYLLQQNEYSVRKLEKKNGSYRVVSSAIEPGTYAASLICSTHSSIGCDDFTIIEETAEANNTYGLTLTDGIEVSFYIDTPFYEAEGGTIKYSYLKTTEDKSAERIEYTVNVADLEAQDNGTRKLTLTAAPAQIAEDYIIEIYDAGGTKKDTITASIEDYCQAIVANSEYAEYYDIARSLLNYGALADEYFGYAALSKEVTGNDYAVAHSEDYKADVDTSDSSHLRTNAHASMTQGSVQIAQISYVALLEPEFRFYLSGVTEAEAAALDVSVDQGLTARVVKTDAGICVSVKGLKASEFAKVFTLTAGDTVISYNGYAYLYTVLTNGSVTDNSLKDLAKGVYRYAAACEAVFE